MTGVKRLVAQHATTELWPQVIQWLLLDVLQYPHVQMLYDPNANRSWQSGAPWSTEFPVTMSSILLLFLQSEEHWLLLWTGMELEVGM